MGDAGSSWLVQFINPMFGQWRCCWKWKFAVPSVVKWRHSVCNDLTTNISKGSSNEQDWSFKSEHLKTWWVYWGSCKNCCYTTRGGPIAVMWKRYYVTDWCALWQEEEANRLASAEVSCDERVKIAIIHEVDIIEEQIMRYTNNLTTSNSTPQKSNCIPNWSHCLKWYLIIMFFHYSQ